MKTDMASEAVSRPRRLPKGRHHRSNMLMDKKVIGVTDFKSRVTEFKYEVRFDL